MYLCSGCFIIKGYSPYEKDRQEGQGVIDDLVRWKAGKLLENLQTYSGTRDPNTSEYRVPYPGFTRTWNDKLCLYPIPAQELILNSNLKQDPGWD